MWIFYLIISGLLLVATLLPKIPSSHWVFRTADFGKIQIFCISLLVFISGFFFFKTEHLFWYVQSVLALILVFHGITLFKFTHFYPVAKYTLSNKHSKEIHIISANVYQFNTDYKRFINLINRYKPDVFLTMESNEEWENALKELEKEYPNFEKVALENTYGIHLYSKLKIIRSKVHYFVADDIPSIEAELETEDGYRFVFFGVHPPPPSPTEEENSKERDGDLLSVAKRSKKVDLPKVIMGDFNNVAWSKSSILFRKTSGLIDPRIGHGFVSTFHAKYFFFRFPIDLLFHSEDVFVKELKSLENFGSDHFPVYMSFVIDPRNKSQEQKVENATSDEIEDAEEMIQGGKNEDGERDSVVTED